MEDGSDVTDFGSFDNSTSKRVLDLLEASYVRLWEVVIYRTTVIKFGMNDGGGKLSTNFCIKVTLEGLL